MPRANQIAFLLLCLLTTSCAGRVPPKMVKQGLLLEYRYNSNLHMCGACETQTITVSSSGDVWIEEAWWIQDGIWRTQRYKYRVPIERANRFIRTFASVRSMSGVPDYDRGIVFNGGCNEQHEATVSLRWRSPSGETELDYAPLCNDHLGPLSTDDTFGAPLLLGIPRAKNMHTYKPINLMLRL